MPKYIVSAIKFTHYKAVEIEASNENVAKVEYEGAIQAKLVPIDDWSVDYEVDNIMEEAE